MKCHEFMKKNPLAQHHLFYKYLQIMYKFLCFRSMPHPQPHHQSPTGKSQDLHPSPGATVSWKNVSKIKRVRVYMMYTARIRIFGIWVDKELKNHSMLSMVPEMYSIQYSQALQTSEWVSFLSLNTWVEKFRLGSWMSLIWSLKYLTNNGI